MSTSVGDKYLGRFLSGLGADKERLGSLYKKPSSKRNEKNDLIAATFRALVLSL